jgi:hypothetical protein
MASALSRPRREVSLTVCSTPPAEAGDARAPAPPSPRQRDQGVPFARKAGEATPAVSDSSARAGGELDSRIAFIEGAAAITATARLQVSERQEARRADARRHTSEPHAIEWASGALLTRLHQVNGASSRLVVGFGRDRPGAFRRAPPSRIAGLPLLDVLLCFCGIRWSIAG